MSNIVSLDHEIMLLPLIGGVLCGHQTSLRNWVIIKVAFRFSDGRLLGCMNQDWDLFVQQLDRYLWALSVV